MRFSSTVRQLAAAAAVTGPVALLLLAAAPSEAPAQDDAAAQVEERQDHMKRLGKAAKTIGGFVKGEGGTVADVQAAARDLDEVAVVLLDLFPEGTAMGVADESYAKPRIWQEWATFEEKAAALPPAADAMVVAAGTGERAQIAAALKQVGDACGGCHELFRQKKPEDQQQQQQQQQQQ